MLFSSAAVAATEIGAITLVEGSVRLLRGTTWYKAVTGARLEDTDIVEASDRAQAQIELASGTTLNLVGPGSVYLTAASAKGASPRITTLKSWLKVAARPPGVRLRAPPFDVVVPEGVAVLHVDGEAVELFVENGSAKLVELLQNGADGAVREAKRGEYVARSATGTYTTVPRAPKAFVDAMPRHYYDALPALAGRLKSKPVLVADREVTYAEAEPWLATRDRAVFERRFAARLRDPAFRSAVLPNVARYPSWDRILHPEKYAPKTAPASR